MPSRTEEASPLWPELPYEAWKDTYATFAFVDSDCRQDTVRADPPVRLLLQLINADEVLGLSTKPIQRLNLIDTESRKTLLGNTLVLIAPKDSTVSLPIEKNFPLLQALGPDGKLAMASVDSVPAGKYGKAALIYLGVWDAVARRVAQAENVRAALAFVALGETPLGIVYGTDAKAEPAVRLVGTFPEESHPKIEYPVALLVNAKPEARKFLDFILSPEAAPIFEAQGFEILAK